MNRFDRGDYIRFTDSRDGSVYAGAALDTRGYGGYAYFRILTAAGEVGLNLNDGKVENLFRAEVARNG